MADGSQNDLNEEHVVHETEEQTENVGHEGKDQPGAGHGESGQMEQNIQPSTCATEIKESVTPTTTNQTKRCTADLRSSDQKRARLQDSSSSSRAPRQYRERRKQIEELCSELCAVGSGVWGSLFTFR